jgi:tetratricopeptide (TPR) repeat protein
VLGRLKGWLNRKKALRELRAFERVSEDGFESFAEAELRRAKAVMTSGNREQGLAIWRQTKAKFPRVASSSRLSIDILLDASSFDEAEALILEGRTRHPSLRHYFRVASARVAQRRGELDQALARCEEVRRRFPINPQGYRIAAECLVQQGKLEEAEAILKQGLGWIPGDIDVRVDWARVAMRRNDWEEALRRWEGLKDYSDGDFVLLGIAECLRMLGRLDEAAAFPHAILRNRPGHEYAMAELARVATAKGDHAESAHLWGAVRGLNPQFQPGYVGGAEAAGHLGDHLGADKILEAGVLRLPNEMELYIEYARSAERRGEGEAALQRWKLLHERFPDCDEGAAHVIEGLL